ncbi:MAG: enoyl-CoA hydratase/isomerase family protein [Desulfobacteraceae bacterium]|jgi:enoyl-CoA hydratase/carnithine racemase|nr:MAG: enoyl-CoA hydratase/isomerase family protein [Desulfobacteraceae bacterium]
MDYETISWDVPEQGLGEISLNRPRRFNSVSYRMMEELEHIWEFIRRNKDILVVILKGSGERGFCAGLDMKEAVTLIGSMNADQFYEFQSRLARIMVAMRRAPQPIVCAIHGPAVGLGFSMALASDVRIISSDARFSAAFINVGLGGADMACSYFLPRLMGAGRAYELMLTGNFLSAQEALSLGLVSRVVERDSLMAETLDMARTIKGKNPLGLRLTKEAINVNMDVGGLEQALSIEDRNQTLLLLRSMLERGNKASRYF